jgi:hypothetical protein
LLRHILLAHLATPTFAPEQIGESGLRSQPATIIAAFAESNKMDAALQREIAVATTKVGEDARGELAHPTERSA